MGDDRTVTVTNFEVASAGDRVVASCRVRDNSAAETELRYEIDGAPGTRHLSVADAFFAPCLLYALKRRANLHVGVPISERLAFSASDIAFIVGTQLGYDTDPAIWFDEIVTVRREGRGAIAGFSSGVDSWFTLKRAFLDCNAPSLRLNTLLVNDVGANKSEAKRREVVARAREVAGEHDLGIVIVRSNMDRFLSMGFQATHTIRNASVAHLLTSLCDTFHYASTNTYRAAGVFPTYDMESADTILLPLLSTDAMRLFSSGSTKTRAEKTRAIVDIPGVEKRLDVCVHDRPDDTSPLNCGRCMKCQRTAVTLEALGVLDRFAPVFDMRAYRRFRPAYLHLVATSSRPMEREVFDVAREAGLVGPRALYLPGSLALRAARWAPKAWSSRRRRRGMPRTAPG